MRASRRLMNPIFLEDEDHNFKTPRNRAGKTLFTLLVLVSLAGLVLLVRG